MAAKRELTIKSVAFNREDPDQMALLEHASKRSNFSYYIKRLIQRDLEGGKEAVEIKQSIVEDNVDSDLMSGLI